MNDVNNNYHSSAPLPAEIVLKPIKAVIVGLLLCFIGVQILSAVTHVAFAVSIEAAITEDGFPIEVTSNIIFLLIDSTITLFFLFWCGRFFVKFIPGKENKFGIIVASITAVLYIANALTTIEVLSSYPIWYLGVSFIAAPVVIYFGAKSKE